MTGADDIARTVDHAFGAAESVLAAAARHDLAGERRLTIAGLRVRLRFAGPRLASILDPAFGHLARRAATIGEAAPDDLVITMIDGALADSAPLAACPIFADGPGPASPCADHGDGALALHDFANRRCLQWIPAGARTPAWAAASPLRTILGHFLATRGRFLVHGAAIGRPSGAVLLAAKGGSGKSTSALACLAAHGNPGAPRLLCAGDDFVVLEPDATRPRVHSLFGTAKVGRAQVALFPGIESLVARDGGPLDDPAEKAVLRLFPGAADRMASTLPVRAIVVPMLALERRESQISPLPRAAGLLALAPSSIFLVPGAGAETLDALAALVAGLPVFRLRIGSDVAGIPVAIASLLDGLDVLDGTPEVARG